LGFSAHDIENMLNGIPEDGKLLSNGGFQKQVHWDISVTWTVIVRICKFYMRVGI